MEFLASQWEIFYTEGEQDATYDVLFYDPSRKEMYILEGIPHEETKGRDSRGERYEARYVEEDVFEVLRDELTGSYWSVHPLEHCKVERPRRSFKNAIPAEQIRRGLRGEMSEDELRALDYMDRQLALDDYFDLDSMLEVVHRMMRGEFSNQYFVDWCLLGMQAMFAHPFRSGTKLARMYDNVADMFDCYGFCSLAEGAAMLRSLICDLKEYEHEISCLKNGGKKTPFYNAGKVIVYHCFDHTSDGGRITCHRVCVADEKHRLIRYGYMLDIDFFEHINYTQLSEKEFDGLSTQYYKYTETDEIDFSRYFGRVVHEKRGRNG
ncbi:MAG: hypothetical protein J6R04_04160 [Clostridia bacterium]|nr:hypothetical protein [Clostridia bacterium]